MDLTSDMFGSDGAARIPPEAVEDVIRSFVSSLGASEVNFPTEFISEVRMLEKMAGNRPITQGLVEVYLPYIASRLAGANSQPIKSLLRLSEFYVIDRFRRSGIVALSEVEALELAARIAYHCSVSTLLPGPISIRSLAESLSLDYSALHLHSPYKVQLKTRRQAERIIDEFIAKMKMLQRCGTDELFVRFSPAIVCDYLACRHMMTIPHPGKVDHVEQSWDHFFLVLRSKFESNNKPYSFLLALREVYLEIADPLVVPPYFLYKLEIRFPDVFSNRSRNSEVLPQWLR